MPEVPDAYAEAAELAAYINWSCVVDPDGYLTRPAMQISKNWLNSVRSCDHSYLIRWWQPLVEVTTEPTACEGHLRRTKCRVANPELDH